MKLKKFEIKPVSDNPFREALLGVGIITGFIFIVLFSSFYVDDAIKQNNACGCVIPIPYMILILSSLGVFVGSLMYYIMASKYSKKKKSSDENIRYTLKFLEPDERMIIKALIDQRSPLRQSELERFTKLGKVKIHRIVQKLVQKEVIIRSPEGKAVYLSLKDELKKVFN